MLPGGAEKHVLKPPYAEEPPQANSQAHFTQRLRHLRLPTCQFELLHQETFECPACLLMSPSQTLLM